LRSHTRNSAGFCGGGHGLSWAVEPRKEKERSVNSYFLFYFPQMNEMREV